MNALPQSAEPLQIVRPSPAMARRKGATEATTAETYGGEALPVLIRLPDLTRPVILPLSVAEEPALSEADGGHDDSRLTAEPVPDPQPARLPSGQRRHQRRPRTIRRPHRDREVAGWLRGLGQLAMAAVLAGVLLVIVITIKHWNAENAQSRPDGGIPFADAPDFDFSGPVLEPASNTRAQQDSERGLPAMSRQSTTLRDMLPAEVSGSLFSGGRQPSGATGVEVPGAPGVARHVPRLAASDDSLTRTYPSTGVPELGPMGRSPVSPGSATAGPDNIWNAPAPAGHQRNAARPSADPRNERR